jgi:hypothetical protein
MGRKADGTLVELPITAGGKLDTSASVTPVEGGATEDKQDDMIAALAGGLPLALGAGGGVKIDGSGTALPISAASLPLPTGAATETTVAALNAKFPAAATLSDTIANMSATQLAALGFGWNSGTATWRRTPVNSTGVGSAFAVPIAPGSRSGSTSLQIQRTIAGFSCTPRVVRAWSSTAGFICLANASSAVADGFTPYGGHVYEIEAGKNLTLEWDFAETFTTGLVVVFCTQIHSGASLATLIGTTACCMFTGQYD